jgi:RNA polymerase sigma-54 factor
MIVYKAQEEWNIVMKAQLVVAQKQSISLLMKRSLELFQLPFDELQNFVQEQIDSNPFLKIPESSDFLSDQHVQQIQHLSLYDHLINQVARWEERDLAIELIGHLDEDGYFRESISDLEKKLKVNNLEIIIKKLQTLDPIGVFARSLQECFELQLRELSEWSDEWKNFLDHVHLPHQKIIQVFSKTKTQSLFKRLKKLTAIPGEAFKLNSNTEIIPDLTAKFEEDEWKCFLNSYINPIVEVENNYKSFVKNCDGTEKEQMKGFLQNAKWLSNTLMRRAEMLKNVTICILNYQKNFLISGKKGLKPLTLKCVAEQLDVHESTISRIIKHKYVQTECGTFPLKFFFSQALHSNIYSWDETKVSAHHVQDYIRELIEKEPKNSPYSDQVMVEILKNRGIIIARRTVTKYRLRHNIPAASQRKGLYIVKL